MTGLPVILAVAAFYVAVLLFGLARARAAAQPRRHLRKDYAGGD